MKLHRPDSCAIVIYGASGDLTKRKILPALYDLHARGYMPENYLVIGYSRTDLTDDVFRKTAREAIDEFGRSDIDEEDWERFAKRLRYVSGDVATEGAMSHLKDHLNEADEKYGCSGKRLFYCATPPQAFSQIVARIGEEGLATNAKIVIEKPFGGDLDQAKELNLNILDVFDEEQVYRIDHYLGKETVQNVLVLRFANGIFEPLWNAKHVSYVTIDVDEALGIEGRGGFYEPLGAVKDVAQNHLLQLLALLAMEPPISFEAEAIRDEKVKLLRSVVPPTPKDVVRGQYTAGEVDGESVPGYREEDDVAADSDTETFIAMRLSVDNWRWGGVPFFLRTGKRMPRSATRATIVFDDAPQTLFEDAGIEAPISNRLRIRFQPNEGIDLTLDAKVPGPEMKVTPVEMDFRYADSFMTDRAEAYERLIHDVMEGDRTLFTRADEIERSWEIVDPILERSSPEEYPGGTWPRGIERLMSDVISGH